jgi:hypothetical protein
MADERSMKGRWFCQSIMPGRCLTCDKMATIGEKLSGERQRNLWKILWGRAQSIQSARLFLQSTEWDSPTPHPKASLSPLLVRKGGHTSLREKGWGGGPNSDGGTDTVVI